MAQTALNRTAARALASGYLSWFLWAVLAASVVVALWRYDRRPPIIYIDTEISPSPARAGGDIFVRRYVEWTRVCHGETSTEIVSPKGYVVPRDRRQPTVPTSPTRLTIVSTLTLPKDLLSEQDATGIALYRGVIEFRDCGLTSRIFPIRVPIQERYFEVRH